jgi:hypothetical protein
MTQVLLQLAAVIVVLAVAGIMLRYRIVPFGMAVNLVPVPNPRLSDYGYPATALVEEVSGDGYTFHRIRYTAAPAALFDNAPNGSELFDTTNSALYWKNGTYGKADGSWVSETLS